MRVVFLSVVLALLLLLAGFLTVYIDYGASSVYAAQEWSEEQQGQVDASLHFLNGREERLDFYTPDERSHLADVRRLLNSVQFLFGLCIVILLANGAAHYRRCKKLKQCACKPLIQQVLLWGGLGTMAVVLLLTLLSLFDFTSFWASFHGVFFPQGNWQFPLTSTLITLFPESFFRAFATQTLLASWSYGIVAVILSYFLRTTPSG